MVAEKPEGDSMVRSDPAGEVIDTVEDGSTVVMRLSAPRESSGVVRSTEFNPVTVTPALTVNVCAAESTSISVLRSSATVTSCPESTVIEPPAGPPVVLRSAWPADEPNVISAPLPLPVVRMKMLPPENPELPVAVRMSGFVRALRSML
jgi:hypothetical protein